MVSRSVIDDPRYVGRKAELVSIEEFFWEGNQSTAIVQHLAHRKIQVSAPVPLLASRRISLIRLFAVWEESVKRVWRFVMQSNTNWRT